MCPLTLVDKITIQNNSFGESVIIGYLPSSGGSLSPSPFNFPPPYPPKVGALTLESPPVIIPCISNELTCYTFIPPNPLVVVSSDPSMSFESSFTFPLFYYYTFPHPP